MRRLSKLFMFAFLGALAMGVQAKEEKVLKPFVLAYSTMGTVAEVSEEVKGKLSTAGYQVVGEYRPYETATIVVVTNEQLKRNASKSDWGGYGAGLRVSITSTDGEIHVAYTNPVYMAHAYRMSEDNADVAKQLKEALGWQEEYGSEDGLTADDLEDYHYMLGMEYFDEPSLLSEYEDYETAVKTIEKNLQEGTAGVKAVYRIDIPGKDETVWGVAMQGEGEEGQYMDDSFIMKEIDFKDVRSSAHLPYEILLSGNKAYALYARFRIAINFPDLSMMGSNSFMNIMDSPEAICKALTQAAGGKFDDNEGCQSAD